MTARRYAQWATLLSVAGTGFSGYLSAHRFFLGVCAFDETCPFFLGHPACYTGFALFAAAWVVSLVALLGRVTSRWPQVAHAAIATLGVLFAGRLTLAELSNPGPRPFLGLPTCAYGFVFFAALLALSLRAWVGGPGRAVAA